MDGFFERPEVSTVPLARSEKVPGARPACGWRDMSERPNEKAQRPMRAEDAASMGEGDLLAQALAGETWAFRAILDRHRGRVFANCYRILADSAEAEDAVQECFSRLWDTLTGRSNASAPDRDAGGWLMRTSRNLCIDRLRRRKRWVHDETVMEMQADDSPSAEAGRQTQDVGRAVREAMDGLPDRQRVALAMVHFEGLPQQDAARQMDVSVDALESLLARGRRTLKAALAAKKEDLI